MISLDIDISRDSLDAVIATTDVGGRTYPVTRVMWLGNIIRDMARTTVRSSSDPAPWKMYCDMKAASSSLEDKREAYTFLLQIAFGVPRRTSSNMHAGIIRVAQVYSESGIVLPWDSALKEFMKLTYVEGI